MKKVKHPSASAFALAGEILFDFAYEQLAKNRPGWANYCRLRELQDVGEALTTNPELYATAPEFLQSMRKMLAKYGSDPDDLETMDAGIKIARAAIAKSTKKKP